MKWDQIEGPAEFPKGVRGNGILGCLAGKKEKKKKEKDY